MPLALGLILVLPIVGALHRSNEIFELPKNGTVATQYDKYTAEEQLSSFSITKILPEGEIQRVTRWRGNCAKETIVDWGHTKVALREVSLKDSKRKLQLIYEGERLTDCIDNDLAENEDRNCSLDGQSDDNRKSVEMRIDMFERNNNEINENSPISRWFVSTANLRDQCIIAKAQARKQLISHQKQRRIERSLQRMVIAPGTKWCGPHRTATTYKELGALDHVDRCCRRHDHCYRAIPPFSERYNLWNYMPFTLSHCGCDQRISKFSRDSFAGGMTIERKQRIRRDRRSRSRERREILLIPGTQWCGRGNRATKYTNLGGFGKADSCCRRHDTACPFYIPAFHSRYGLFNWGISTIMHCTCDERFRTCLKMAGTSSANFIGRIFFNVVQTKCFVLKPHKVCTRQSWWGKCEKHEYKKQAHIRNNVPY